jgi:hypothetical protein
MNRYVWATATAPHLDSTEPCGSIAVRRTAGIGAQAPFGKPVPLAAFAALLTLASPKSKTASNGEATAALFQPTFGATTNERRQPMHNFRAANFTASTICG